MILERVLSPFWLWHIRPSCHPFTTVLVKFKFILISYFQTNIFSLFICFIHRLLFQGLFVSGCVWSYLPWGFNGKTLTNISETRNQIRPFLFSYSFLFLLFFTLSHYMSVSNTLIILMLKWGTFVFLQISLPLLQISLPLSLFFFFFESPVNKIKDLFRKTVCKCKYLISHWCQQCFNFFFPFSLCLMFKCVWLLHYWGSDQVCSYDPCRTYDNL